jgi:hypothetical protein
VQIVINQKRSLKKVKLVLNKQLLLRVQIKRQDKIRMSKDWIKIVRKDYRKVNKNFLILAVDVLFGLRNFRKYEVFENNNNYYNLQI